MFSLSSLKLGTGRLVGGEEESEVTINLGNILVFVTGAIYLPPMGFESTPEIRFTGDIHATKMRLTSASTCGPTLYLPLSLSDPDVFAKKMDMAIIGAQCFASIVAVVHSVLFYTCTVIVMLYLTVVDCRVNHSFLKVGPFDYSNSHVVFDCSGLSW